MQKICRMFQLLSDESRLRMLMLLQNKELCVCQIMGVLGMSQPLVSRNLSLLAREGFLESRREGKLMFYRKKRKLQKAHLLTLSLLDELLKGDRRMVKDTDSLKACEEYQKKTGRCDMDTLKSYMEYIRSRRQRF
ncbi:MAG: ArsR/SmtB family transcription factor [Dissulfurispiraceae bacterium]